MSPEQATPAAPPAAPGGARRVARRIAAILGGLALVLVALLALLLATPQGPGLALRAAGALTAGRLQAARVEGRLLGPLALFDLRYRDVGAGIDLTIGELRLELAAPALLRGRVHLEALELRHLVLRLAPGTDPPDDAPPALQPPVDLQVDRLRIDDARIERDGEPLLQVTTARAILAWTDAGLRLPRLQVVAPQGEIDLAVDAALAGGRARGHADGRFRWQAGARRFAGRLDARADATRATLQLRLAEPLVAELRLELAQRPTWPWQLALEVPAFDPRRRVLPDTAVSRVAARIRGRGDRDGGAATGTVELDEVPIDLQPLRITRRGPELVVDARLRSGAARLQVAGELQPARKPFAARLELGWQDVTLPVALAGQPLRSAGSARLAGSLEHYEAEAAGRLGPVGRMADVELALTGDAGRVAIRRLEVRQAAGRLAAHGEVGFAAGLRWRVEADARDFDPGAFLAGWPGRLSFALGSAGSLPTPQDAEATLRIAALRGRLRGRAVAGRGTLALRPGLQLSGALELRSGASRVRLDGRRGAELDATLRAEVPDLGDWLPDAAGSLDAQLAASGRWPGLRLAGAANGRALSFRGGGVRSAALEFDVTEPLDPHGRLRLQARELQAGGVQAGRLAIELDGEPTAHRLRVDARGTPVSVALRLEGGLAAGRWRGQLLGLEVEAARIARLALLDPARLAWSGTTREFEVAPACLADGETRVCVEGRGQLDGALQVRYSVRALPLALAAALAPTPLPVAIEGRLAGRGELRRDALGRIEGEARLEVPRARLALAEVADAEASQRLLDVAGLGVVASFTGRQASATLAARLDEYGAIDGRLRVAGLDTADPRLDGDLRTDLPSLAVAGVFLPQLAGVDGRLRVALGIGGTLAGPRLAGEVLASGLRADVPALGLALRDGRLRLVPQADGHVQVEGSIRSGDGELALAGAVSADGAARGRITGRGFLAADRPGARVVLAPELELAGDLGRVELAGRIAVPAARIDLQRLPRGDRAPAASPDVVVIDDTGPAAGGAEAPLPVYANLELSLGEAVELTGYGLDARLAGNLRLRERPGQVTTAAGEIRVSGVYQAYGQDLTIREGRLLYAGTPLDDPRLKLVAVRVVDTVTAGLRVSGSARAPQLEVFSDPAMGQAGALAYLVAGRPLEEIGQGDAGGDALEAAARSLGTAAGGLLARSVGRRLGVDVLGIEDSDALGGAALTIGQYLSPRLFVSYGVGLFDPGEVVTLSYRIARSLTIEAQSATDSSRVGLEYRAEK